MEPALKWLYPTCDRKNWSAELQLMADGKTLARSDDPYLSKRSLKRLG